MPRMALDPYAVLGVRRGASQQEIARAYRRLARRHHPDADAAPDATERMRRINAAFRTLSDPLARRKLERAATAAGQATGPRTWSSPTEHWTARRRRDRAASWQQPAWRASPRPTAAAAAAATAAPADGSFQESGLAAALVGLGILLLAFAAIAVGSQVPV